MQLRIYDALPKEAMDIRKAVFIDEQGFKNEFDGIDSKAVHIVAFDSDRAIATCRVFRDDKMDSYVLGRLAVIKDCRGKNVGASVVEKALDYVRKAGGKELMLHAQCRIVKFYNKLGFEEFGEIGDDEGCPHIWMKKSI